MDTPKKKLPDPFSLMLRLKIAAAWLVLCWERFWLAFWPALGIVGLFIASAMLNLLFAFGTTGHTAIVLGFFAVFLFALGRGIQIYRWPDIQEAKRLLEQASDTPHRPLTEKDDRPVETTDAAAHKLWALHRQRQGQMLRRLTPRWPRPVLARRDPYALRVAVLLLLVIGLVIAGDRWPTRVWSALEPHFAILSEDAARQTQIDAWITPPEYTHVPPVFLDPKKTQPVTVPMLSTLLVRVTGGRLPVLYAGESETPFTQADMGKYELSHTLQQGETYIVKQGFRTLGSWPVNVTPDHPPAISLKEEDTGQERSALKLGYAAEDDYGITKIRAFVKYAADPAQKPLTLELPPAPHRQAKFENTTYHDLSSHPWAGSEVTLQLEAEDTSAQHAKSRAITLVLPERQFTHPVARRLVELRRKLLQDTPPDREEIYRSLQGVMVQTGAYHDDLVVFLSLRSAASRLLYNKSGQEDDSIQQLMWDTALRLEDGDIALRARDLKQAHQELLDALNSETATDEEISRLMRNFQNALNNYLEAIGRDLHNRMARGENIPVIPQEFVPDVLGAEEFSGFLEQLQQLLQNGSRQAAREMLNQFQHMMEGMNYGEMQEMPPELKQALESMQDLNRIIEDQEKLILQTEPLAVDKETPESHKDTKEGLPTPPEEQGATTAEQAPIAVEQRQIRGRLGTMMRHVGEVMGDIPQNFGQAERLMRRAEEELTKNNLPQGLAFQKSALKALKEAKQSYTQQLMKMLQQMAGMGIGLGQGEGVDPLGRRKRRSWVSPQSDVKIPKDSELRRVQRILEELRRRSNDSDRPELEREYIERLLKRF